jgi:hypothetical protein
VPNVQDIEAAIRENDAPPFFTRARELPSQRFAA